MDEQHQSGFTDLAGFELVSVVVPVLNEAEMLPTQLEALASQTYRGAWEVVVADNGSDDGTAEAALGWSDRLPGLRVVYAPERRNRSYALNMGARAARGDFIAVCDADDVVEPRWLEALVEVGRTCDIVGGSLDRTSLNSAMAQSWRPGPNKKAQPIFLGMLPYAPGGNCGVRTEVFRALGGWREAFVSGQDTDFSWRAQLASYSLCYARHAVVRYRYREDLRAHARQFFRYGQDQPRLYRHYRDLGMPRSSLRVAWRQWAWTAAHIGDLRGSSQKKGIWIRKAAYRWGRLVGSIRQRVLFL